MIAVSVRGLHEAIATLSRVASLNTASLMPQVGQTVEIQTRRRITSEKRAPSGQRWAPLKPSTVARKGSSEILIHHGKLVGSVAHQVGGHVAVVGTSPFYGAFHQSGTRKMPARPFIGLSAVNERQVEQVVMAFVRRQF